jgi:YaiO family outer membrane protein
MKRNVFFLLVLFLSSNLGGSASLAGGQEDIGKKASAAIKSKEFSTAIALCLEGLRQNHADYELNFLLGRAYAHSGRWDEALRVLDDLALAHPENTDVLLFRARVKAWKHDYKAAETGFNEVLRLNPGNSEALIGLAEIASWQGDYAGALAFYWQVREKEPANADIYFRVGRIHLWDGNYDKARANFEKARSLDPQNKEVQRALKMATPRVRDQYELRTECQAESFSDSREDYIDQRLAFQFKLSTLGPLILKANTTARYDSRDYQYGFELYPRLWSRAYAYIDALYSPRALYYPKTCYLAEIYQAVSSSWDVSLGYRRMNFTAQSVNILLGSIGRYFGQTIAFLRWYYTPDGEGETFSWAVNLRRYFTDSSYIYAAYGRGSRPFDIVSIEDYSVTRSWVFFTGLDWTIRQRIRIQLNYTYRNEGALRRNLLFIGAGYRW